MMIGRRFVVSSMALTPVALRVLLAAQWDHTPSARPNPRLPPQPIPPELIPEPKSNANEVLKENLKNLRHNVDQLVQLAQDLKVEADKTNETNVLSLALVHKADDVEKLARQIKSLARAS